MFNLYLNRHYMIKKATCIGVITAFFVSFIYVNARPAVGIERIPFEVPGKEVGLFAQFKPDTFTVPAHLGEIKYKYESASDRFIIHIQDAHCNYFAQRKIYDIIDYLNREYGISMINLEGGVGDYDLTPLTSITNRAVRREVSEYFAKKGEINGAELYAGNNPGKVTLWGVEDKDLYLANLNVYRDFLSYKAAAEKYLNELTRIMENLKRHIYTPDLLRIDRAYNEYKAEKMDFRDYLEFLVDRGKKNNIQISSFQNLEMLLRAMGQEKDVDFKEANMERNELVEMLKKRLSKQEISELVIMSLDFKNRKISHKEFYGYLLKKGRELKINVKRFPALSTYIEYVSSYEAVDRSDVMKEMDELEAQIKERLYRNDTERRLNTLSRNLAILKNIFAFSLNKNDYRYYLENKDSFEIANYLEFIRRESPRYKITAALSPDITNMDDYRGRIMGFYDYSFKRDEVFIENVRFDALNGGSRGAVLITGGFHTENLRELCEKEDIQYVSILPLFINKKGYQSPYFDLLAGESTGMEEMLRTIMAQVSMLQVASNLNELGGDAFGRSNIESFRAAVAIRTLVQQGYRVTVTDAEGGVLFTEGKGAPITISIWEVIDRAHELHIDRPITEAFERGDVKTLEEEGLGATRGMARTFLEDTAAALRNRGYAEQAAKLTDAANALADVRINLLTNVEGFVAHAGGMGMHINKSAVTDEAGETDMERLAGHIIHEAVAAFARDHGVSTVMEEMYLGISDVTDSSLAEILREEWHPAVWDIEARGDRLAGGRDFAFREVDLRDLGGEYSELEKGFLRGLLQILGPHEFGKFTRRGENMSLVSYDIPMMELGLRGLSDRQRRALRNRGFGDGTTEIKILGYLKRLAPDQRSGARIRYERKLFPVTISEGDDVQTRWEEATSHVWINKDAWDQKVALLKENGLRSEAEAIVRDATLAFALENREPDAEAEEMYLYREVTEEFAGVARKALETIGRSAEEIIGLTEGDSPDMKRFSDTIWRAVDSLDLDYNEYKDNELGMTISQRCAGVANFIAGVLGTENVLMTELNERLDELKQSDNKAFRFFAEKASAALSALSEQAGMFSADARSGTYDIPGTAGRTLSAGKAVIDGRSGIRPWNAVMESIRDFSDKSKELRPNWDTGATEIMGRIAGDNAEGVNIINRALDRLTETEVRRIIENAKSIEFYGKDEKGDGRPQYWIRGIGTSYLIKIYEAGKEEDERAFNAYEAGLGRLKDIAPTVLLRGLRFNGKSVNAVVRPADPRKVVALEVDDVLEAMSGSIEELEAKAQRNVNEYSDSIGKLSREIEKIENDIGGLESQLEGETKERKRNKLTDRINKLTDKLAPVRKERDDKQRIMDTTRNLLNARRAKMSAIESRVKQLRQRMLDQGFDFPGVDEAEFRSRCGFQVADTTGHIYAGLVLFDIRGITLAEGADEGMEGVIDPGMVNGAFPGAEGVPEVIYRALIREALSDKGAGAEKILRTMQIISNGESLANADSIMETIGEVDAGLVERVGNIVSRINSEKAVTAKIPGTDVGVGAERMQEIAREIRGKPEAGVNRYGESSDMVGRANDLLQNMAGMDEAAGGLPDDTRIGNVEVVAYDLAEYGLADELEATSYFNDAGILVIVVNSNAGKSNDYFAGTQALEHLVRHEFMEAEPAISMEHRDIKRLEMIENGMNALTVLNLVALRHMTLEQLGNIAESHELDPGGLFYSAAATEIEARHARGILENARPSPCAILMPLTEDQKITDGSAFRKVASDAERRLDKKYGTNIGIYYYDPLVPHDDKTSLSNMSEKAMEDRDFREDEGSRLLAYVPQFMSREDIESFKTGMKGKKFAGVVQENIAEGETYDEVLHVVLGIGLIDYSKSASLEMAGMVKNLLSAMVEDASSLEGMDLKRLLEGIVLLRLKKMDYGEIRDWKDAQDEVLRAL